MPNRGRDFFSCGGGLSFLKIPMISVGRPIRFRREPPVHPDPWLLCLDAPGYGIYVLPFREVRLRIEDRPYLLAAKRAVPLIAAAFLRLGLYDTDEGLLRDMRRDAHVKGACLSIA